MGGELAQQHCRQRDGVDQGDPYQQRNDNAPHKIDLDICHAAAFDKIFSHRHLLIKRGDHRPPMTKEPVVKRKEGDQASSNHSGCCFFILRTARISGMGEKIRIRIAKLTQSVQLIKPPNLQLLCSYISSQFHSGHQDADIYRYQKSESGQTAGH